MKNYPLLLLALPLSLSTSSIAAVVYDEGVSGDLSGDFSAPTPIVLTNGANTVIGQTGLNGDLGATDGTNDADYWSFTIAPGAMVTSLTVDLFSFSPNDPGVSLAAYTDNLSFTGQGGADIEANVLFDAGSGNILDDLGGALPAGDYAFWVQETSDNIVDYQLTFNQVPEPATTAFGAVTLGILFFRRRRVGK